MKCLPTWENLGYELMGIGGGILIATLLDVHFAWVIVLISASFLIFILDSVNQWLKQEKSNAERR